MKNKLIKLYHFYGLCVLVRVPFRMAADDAKRYIHLCLLSIYCKGCEGGIEPFYRNETVELANGSLLPFLRKRRKIYSVKNTVRENHEKYSLLRDWCLERKIFSRQKKVISILQSVLI